MTPTGPEILESEAWKQALVTLDLELWEEHNRLALGDQEGLTSVKLRRWALHRMAEELETKLDPAKSINLPKSQ